MSLPIRIPRPEVRNPRGPHVALLAVQIIFGTWPIFGKVALRGLPSAGLVVVRAAGAAAAFLLLMRLRGRLIVPPRADLARLALYGLLGVALNQFMFIEGLALSTAVNATLLSACIPVFTLLVGAALGRERLTARVVAGTAVAAAGVITLVDPLRASFSAETTLGNFLLVANTAAYGAYIAVSRDVFRRYGALTAMAWVFSFGALMTVPFGGYYLARVDWRAVGWVVWLAVVYIILVPTVGAYYLNAWALERAAPSTVAVYVYLQPLFAFALAPLLLGAAERPGARHAVATALIFAGLAFVTLRRRRPPPDAPGQTDAPGR